MQPICPASRHHASIQHLDPEAVLHPRLVFCSGSGTALGKRLTVARARAGFVGRFTETLDAPVDLALIADAAEDVPAVLTALSGKLRGLAVVYSEIGSGALAVSARKARVRAVGGRSFGIANPKLGLNAILAPRAPKPGRVALLSQSHALTRAVIDWATPNGIGFSHIVGIGDNTDVGFGRILDHLARDAETGLILLDISHLRDPRLFLSAARAASRLRPIVALAPGALLSDPSFTALTAFEAALSRSGVLLTRGYGEFLATAETLVRARPASGQDLAIVGNGLGCVRLAADAALSGGIALTRLTPETRQVLALALDAEPEASASIAVLDAPGTKLADLAALLAAAPEVGGVLVVHAPSLDQDDSASIDALIACGRSITKPLLVAVLGETTGAALRHRLADQGIAVFANPEDAVSGFGDLLRYQKIRAAARELPASTVVEIKPQRDVVRSVIDVARQAGQSWLTQEQAFEVLAAYQLDVLPTRTCNTADAVGKAASELGFPVVVKLLHPDFVTSRPEGSIAVDLPDGKSARAAASVIGARLRSRDEWPEGAEFIVQTQVRDASELRIRVADQPVIGPTIGFGRGGGDPGDLSGLSVDLPPLNMALAEALIDRAGGAAILQVHRGLAHADRAAVETALVTVSQIIVDCPEISLLDIDPLFARQSGIAIGNVRIGLRSVGEKQPTLAIRPYPDELVGHVDLGGRRFIVRPIRPEDAEAHARLFARLPPEDIRRRFFSAIRVLTSEQLVRLTEIDYTRELALIAVEAASGETVGVARLVCSDAEGTEAEFATLIEPGAKEIGLGSVLMRRLIDWAKREGVRRIVGQVLSENTPMLAFVRRLGFSVRHVPGEDDVVEASLDLS